MLNPEKIVLGGHLAIVLNTISDADRGLAFEDALNASSQAVVVEAAALGPDRLILGAAELVWDQHITNPLADPAAAPS